MKDYTTYSAIDFTNDDHFFMWVKYPQQSRQRERFWTTWTARHPEKAVEVEEAKRLILAVIEESQYIPSEHKQREIWLRLQQSIQDKKLVNRKINFFSGTYKIAATILLVLSVVATIWWVATNNTGEVSPHVAELDVIKEFNNGTIQKTIVLGDGSSIILMPKSSLEFPSVFDNNYREVKLSGEAFFEVAKDAKRPFLVHADKLITKVLGTSFNIRAYENEKNVLVQVKTGKVSVFTEADMRANEQKGNSQLEGVLLIPNQQVVFSREESRMVKSLVENPALLNSSINRNFVFSDTPLKEVFDNIEKAYGIEIVFDEEIMANCLLNASLDDMPLYDKLRLICKGINAQYEILDSHIIVSGKGCN
ncbi:MAG: FecR family protein [Cyclobacteriaceae bacterium]